MELAKSNNIKFSAHLAQFISLDQAEHEMLLDHFKVRQLRKNQLLLREGEYARFTFWVSKGLLVSTFTDPKGKEHVIQFAIENCWITDQDAFYNHKKSTFRITALEETEVLALSYDAREQLCQRIPKMEHFFRRKANDSFVKQQKRLLTYLTSNAQERFELLVEEYPSLLQRIPKTRIAAYLGVSRETLSRFVKD